MYVIVDELDRCRPTYAISLLERIKHLFSVDNVVFITGTAGRQLSVSIAAVYGQSFDSLRYLHRFLDRTYQLAEPRSRPLIEAFLATSPKLGGARALPNLDTATYLEDVFSAYGFGARDVFQTLDLIHTVLNAWSVPQKPIMAVLVPFACQYHLRGSFDSWIEILDACLGPLGRVERRLTQFTGPEGQAPTIQHLFHTFRELASLTFQGLAAADDHDQGMRKWVQHILVDDYNDDHRTFVVKQYHSMLRAAGRLA